MLPDGRRLGAHLALGHGMVRAAERAHEIGADTLQVFVDNPTAWRRRAALPRELPAFRARLDALGLEPLAVHAAYLVNLAGPDPSNRERSIAVLASELAAAEAFGARFLNVHVGSHRGAGIEAGIDLVGEAIARVLPAGYGGGRERPILLLENSAGAGDGLGTDPAHLGAILASAAGHGAELERVGFCLDTAHAWGAGHPVDTAQGVDALVAALDATVGLDRLRLVHLNDSRAELGSRADRHEHLGAGRIGVPGLRRVLTHPALAHATYILETPGMDEGYDAINVARAQAIARGQALEPLPPDASLVGSGRSRAVAGPRDDAEEAAEAMSEPA
jgi:deoxyribonuclease-4